MAGVVRKRPATDGVEQGNGKAKDSLPAKISKSNGSEVTSNDKVDAGSISSKSDENGRATTAASAAAVVTSNTKIDFSVHDKGAMKCIGILPGIGKYRDSSDSEKSTDTDDDYDFSDFDWVGRKVKKGHEDGCHE